MACFSAASPRASNFLPCLKNGLDGNSGVRLFLQGSASTNRDKLWGGPHPQRAPRTSPEKGGCQPHDRDKGRVKRLDATEKARVQPNSTSSQSRTVLLKTHLIRDGARSGRIAQRETPNSSGKGFARQRHTRGVIPSSVRGCRVTRALG